MRIIADKAAGVTQQKFVGSIVQNYNGGSDMAEPAVHKNPHAAIALFYKIAGLVLDQSTGIKDGAMLPQSV